MAENKAAAYRQSVCRWDVQEIRIQHEVTGNPYTDMFVTGRFESDAECVCTEGYYDGDRTFACRFMPSFTGEYRFMVEIRSSTGEADTYSGTFKVLPARPENHGIVRVANTYHFAYEDGTPYYPNGTTAYVFHLQSDEQIEKSFASLQEAGFNKMRFCIFPKHYVYNLRDPRDFPYEGTPMDASVLNEDNFGDYTGRTEGNSFDFFRFRPSYFQHLDRIIERLGNLGVEADLIMLHPYDRWGFSTMPKESDDLYFRYLAARYSAYHNVWWSLANEYDLMPAKELPDWERLAGIIVSKDPYHHLRSVHNCIPFYDYSRPWITHCCIQRQEYYKTAEYTNLWREKWGKPIVLDEIAYEGNLERGWGNIPAQELVRRCWEAACRGGYGGHGETYMDPEGVIWWSHGGALKGESWKRLAFLHQILEMTPGIGLRPEGKGEEVRAVPEDTCQRIGSVRDYYLIYYSFMQPSFRTYYFDDTSVFELHVIDTWNMTVTDVGEVRGRFRVELPSRPFMAVQLVRKGTVE